MHGFWPGRLPNEGGPGPGEVQRTWVTDTTMAFAKSATARADTGRSVATRGTSTSATTAKTFDSASPDASNGSSAARQESGGALLLRSASRLPARRKLKLRQIAFALVFVLENFMR